MKQPLIKTCRNKQIITRVMKADFWCAVVINGNAYMRTFQNTVIYHPGLKK